MPPKISICIAACNEEAKIRRALESARACSWCDELLVVDSGSTDGTLAIADELADRVEHQEWIDYSISKRNMTEMARNDWVFILDADETITPQLAADIGRLDDAAFKTHSIISMPRRNYLLGRPVPAWDPDRQDRLIDRRRVHWPSRSVHDSREPTEGTKLHLSGRLLHNAGSDDFTDYFDGPRYAARAEAMAEELFRQGRRVGWLGLYFHPWAAFVKFYVLKRGFLDGAFGLMVAQKAAFSVQLKYARLWHLQQAKQKVTETSSGRTGKGP